MRCVQCFAPQDAMEKKKSAAALPTPRGTAAGGSFRDPAAKKVRGLHGVTWLGLAACLLRASQLLYSAVSVPTPMCRLLSRHSPARQVPVVVTVVLAVAMAGKAPAGMLNR